VDRCDRDDEDDWNEVGRGQPREIATMTTTKTESVRLHVEQMCPPASAPGLSRPRALSRTGRAGCRDRRRPHDRLAHS
jgi:hypothetical protein